ncbi:MAG: 50S ribosomal protein L5 [Candidatus Saganbacteria bacterium]|nr:50S ribosomal protein L5 [Candidatus Saganbacteria bacterium]
MATLFEKYKKEIVPAMVKKFGYKNPMQVPKLLAVTVNRGVGEATQNPKAVDISVSELMAITGQKPLITKAKKSISTFKLKQGTPIGCKVTLRGKRMFDFMDKLINICLPRMRDFKGMDPRSFDGRGNYSFGLKEQLIFPEIDYDKIDKVRGMDIALKTSAKRDEEARELLALFGMPFRS